MKAEGEGERGGHCIHLTIYLVTVLSLYQGPLLIFDLIDFFLPLLVSLSNDSIPCPLFSHQGFLLCNSSLSALPSPCSLCFQIGGTIARSLLGCMLSPLFIYARFRFPSSIVCPMLFFCVTIVTRSCFHFLFIDIVFSFFIVDMFWSRCNCTYLEKRRKKENEYILQWRSTC